MRWQRDGWAISSGQYQRSTRGRLPKWYQEQPPRVRGDEVYLKAHARLSTHRVPFGNQVGPIPWGPVDDYAERKRFGSLMHEFFVDVIMLLDQSYREHLEEEEEKAAAKERRRQFKKKKLTSQASTSGREARKKHATGGSGRW